ncbi:Copper Transporter integral membrane protein that functions in high affinity copper transport [Podospora pseudocomata]|uniref:Copper transport protein n=1 Tax=Podospora pseudocomata TaxID=2093779 RepID=A0ABR0GKR9_9PEZI|nr:Copper Transporter integral membrane protein that functions in high affinity copper transport [Podospora pseudocomata]
MDHSNHNMTPTSTITSVIATTTSTAAAAAAGGGHGHGGGTGCKISMLWNWNTIDSCFISSSWKITSNQMFGGSCVGVLLLAITMEALRRLTKEYDRYLVKKHREALAGQHNVDVTQGYRPKIWEQAVRAALHMVQFAVGYFIMLLAMYYNGYIIICIFLGAYLGSFMFHWEPLVWDKQLPRRTPHSVAIDQAWRGVDWFIFDTLDMDTK